MLWDKQAPCCQTSTDSTEIILKCRNLRGFWGQQCTIYLSQIIGGGGGPNYLVPLPQEQGRQVQQDEFWITQFSLPEVASEQGLYQAANGGLQEGLKALPVRMP